jgi:ADP-heptose:LPS heptosyltransferase
MAIRIRARKILVIRFSSIGDIVLTTPVVRCLKQQIPGAEIHYLVKSQNREILEANPYVDKIWLYDHNFDDLIPMLKSQHFGFVVDLHKNYRSSFVKARLNVPSAGFPKLNARKWLAVNLKLNLLPEMHIVDRYFRAVARLNVKNDGQGLDYFIPAGDEVDPEDLPGRHRHGYLAVVIGGKHHTKIFPPGQVAEVCRRLNFPVILLGGKEDRERGDQIVAETGALVLNGCGSYSLGQSASLVRQSRAVLTNDTGLMHIAAAFRKPIVSVWGNTIPGFGMYPYLPGSSKELSLVAEVKGLSCRPCSKLGFQECPKGHFRCMQEIDLGGIVGFIKKFV